MIKITSSLEELAIEGKNVRRLSDNSVVRVTPVGLLKMFQSLTETNYDFNLILIDKHAPEDANAYAVSKGEPLVDGDVGFNYSGGEDYSSIFAVQYYQIVD